MSGRQAPHRATIVQVAKLAGVSIKTVSRVANNEPNVRAELRQRVSEAIRKLGYSPMQTARGLAGWSSRLLALAYAHPAGSYMVRLQRAARHCCHEHGLRLLLHPCDHRDPRLPSQLVRLASDLRLEGMILAPPVSLDEKVIEALAEAQVPVSLLAPARAHAGMCNVLLDDEHAAAALTAHVIGLGHRRVGFVRGHPDHEASRARLAGFRGALHNMGLPVEESLIVTGDFSFESGRSAGAELLDRRTRPTAIIASNDDMAAGVLAAAHDRKLEVPAELAVCGFDDAALAGMLWPPLTTMHQPISELADAGTRSLIEYIRTGRAHRAATPLHYELVVRESTVRESQAGDHR